MAFETLTPLISYPADGVITEFAIPDKFYDASDVKLFYVDAAGAETQFDFGADFSIVITATDPTPPARKSGKAVFVTPPPAGGSVVPFIWPDVDQDQPFEGRPVTPRQNERVHDRHSMRDAALRELLFRGFRAPLNATPALRYITVGAAGRVPVFAPDGSGSLVEGPLASALLEAASIATSAAAIAQAAAAFIGGFASDLASLPSLLPAAIAAKNAAIAAAEATGPKMMFDTYALANAALASIPNLQVVEIFNDETKGGARTLYRKESGALVYKTVAGIDIDDLYLPNYTNAVSVSVREILERGYLTPEFYGAKGGAVNDSVAWDRMVQGAMALGLPCYLTKKKYRIPNATSITMTGDLTIFSDCGSIVDGEKTCATILLKMTNKSVVFRGFQFSNCFEVLVAGDGSSSQAAATLTGNVEKVHYHRMTFDNCRRPMLFIVSKTGPQLAELDILKCYVDGKTTGWAGFFAGWTNMLKARANDNTVINIDATAAGFNPGGTPISNGCGRAINMGGNNPAAGYQFKEWEATGNTVDNITDSRPKSAGSNPEVGGIRITGARHCIITGNHLSNIKSLGTGIDDDCEGIYPKASFSVICNNTLVDAGIGSASIIIKGYNRAQNTIDPDVGSNPSSWGFGGICSGNTIVSTAGGNSGIAVFSSEWIIANNYIEGCGGNNTRLAAIWTNAAQNDNVAIRGNTLINSIGNAAIYMQSYGKNICIENNIIEGLTNPVAGSTGGVYVNNTNGNGFNTGALKLTDVTISGNKIGGIVAQAGSLTRGVVFSSGGSNSVRSRILNNILTGVVDTGIQVGNGTHEGITISGNDLRLAVDKYSTAGSPTVLDMAANSNAGWLYLEVTIDPPSLVAGAVQKLTGTDGFTGVALLMDDVAPRDVFDVTPSGSLSGTRIWAQCDTSGQVDIYQWNPTGASVNLSSRTFRINARKIAA